MSNYNVENLVENFQFVGLNVEDAELAKCLELCISYKVTEEELVDIWVAFSISNLKNAPPSVEGLELLERRELSKNKNTLAATTQVVQTPERKKPLPKSVYNSPSVSKTPVNKSLTQTFNDSLTQDVSTEISASQVGNYADRGNAGKVALAHGAKTQYMRCFSPIHVKLFGDEAHCMPSNVQQMYCHINRQRESQAGITHYIANLIAQKHNITLEAHMQRESSDGTYFGTIVCDGDGKLNKTSALLELPGGDYSNGDKIRLNLSQLASCALFPGQVAVVQGKFIKGTLQVTNMVNDAFVTPIQKFESGSIQIMAAAGPFTLKNNLIYEPLQDLLQTVIEQRPHVLILTGPFLDEDHDNIKTMTDSFDTFFVSLIESIMTPLDGTNIQVILVSSLRDVHHFPVFPTPAYTLANKYPNLLCVPDPCILDIEGIHVGITTADVLFHIGKEEFAYGAGAIDRMSRLSQHLLSQLSFYPLQSTDNKLPIDYGLLERYGLMETSPHVLITPSNFRHFVKNIAGCTVVNPERLVKGYAGGTYARMQINATNELLHVFCEITHV